MNFSKLLFVYSMVFILAAVPFLEGPIIAPVAVLAGLSFWPVFILAVIGNLITVYLLIIFINKVKEWRRAKKKEKQSKRETRAKNLWDKYGLPGLTLIGPFFVGSHVTAFSGILLGGSKKKVAFWMSVSITGWSLLFCVLVLYGFSDVHETNPFVDRLMKVFES
ncbi:small multi-drug export protein [Piscibacillus salipiscarius]|uniref:Small multi-drug export protein n=1 Tax=Piscibacillus salipiscarius TaxID=299480 RepID=A0ABW5QDB6_9BACI